MADQREQLNLNSVDFRLDQVATGRIVLILLCLATAFFILQHTAGTTRTPILQPLSNFPQTLGKWQKKDSYISSPEVDNVLKVDDYIHYSYVTPSSPPITLYLAYYESVGTGGGYHSPKNCLPGGGWGISEVKTVDLLIDKSVRKTAKVTEMIIRNRSEHQVVLYWFQNRGRTIYSEYWEKVHLVLDAILKGRRDGSFIRIMAYSPDGNLQQTEEEARKFAALVYKELPRFIPGK